MTDKLFDDFIKEKVNNHASTVPADMWDRIQREKDKKRTAFWWKSFSTIAILVCIAIIFGWFGFDKADQESIAAVSPTVQNSETVQGLQKDDSQNNAPAINQQAEDGDVVSEEPSGHQDGTSTSSTRATMNRSTSKTVNGLLKPSGVTSRSNFTSAIEADQLVYDNNTNVTEDKSDELLLNYRLNNRSPLFTSLQKESFQLNSGISSLTALKYVPYSFVDCPSNKRTGNRSAYVEFFVSPDIASKKTEYNARGNASYPRKKDSTESSRLSYTVGMRLTQAIGDHLMFKTGLQYSQINEKFSYRNENERNETSVVTIRTIINTQGDTIIVRDTSIFEQVGSRSKTTYNRYRSFDIPVLFSYEFGGETWKAAVNTGAIINLSSWQEGEYLDTSLVPLGFAKGKEPIFKKKIGIGLYGGISLIKSVGARTDFFAEPYLRYNLSNLTTGSSPFTQKFHVAGLLIGVRYRLTGLQATK